MATKSWYVVQLKPGGGKVAERNLEQQGFSFFSPKIRVTRRSRRGFSTGLKPLFPGYMFVAISNQIEGLAAISHTRGVARILSMAANRYTPIPNELIASIRQAYSADGGRAQPEFVQGDVIQIRTGPFAQLFAKVEDVLPNDRIWLLIDALGGNVRLSAKSYEIDLRQAA